MLKDDHRTVEALFKRFEKAGDRAFTLKRTVVNKIIEECPNTPRSKRNSLPGDPGDGPRGGRHGA